MLNHAVSVAWDYLRSRHMSCVGPGAVLFSSYARCAMIRFTEAYFPWKHHFLGDFLLTVCEICIKHGGREFEQSFAALHCHFL